ncbi:MAG TPA: hypothetical protein VNJ12_04895 [Candidatus Dormibacteraeota bacterium]|nr:hypothetical protein [Candidatus Dormibacteraeota bacterium]
MFRLQGRVSGVLSHGGGMPASRESRIADDNGKNRTLGCLAGKPGHGFLPAEILRPDQAGDSAGIRRMRANALGAGSGPRTLAANATETGCVYREKRLIAERAAA